MVEVGDQVDRWSVGDEVCALLGGGGYAELVAVHQDHVLPRPAQVSLTDAGGLAETACTVIANLSGVNGLRPGETLLVHGGGSGIGTTAIQWARARGCAVLTTVGSTAKAEGCRALGADLAIDYRREGFVDVVRGRTAGRGVDVVLDIVGADYLASNLEVLAQGGRLHQVGIQTGTTASLDVRLMMAKRLVLTGSTLRSRSIREKAAVVATVRQELWPYYDSGQMVPVIDSRFPLEEAAEAHRHLESSAHFGKVLLDVGTP